MSARVRVKEVPDLYYFLRAALRNNCFPSKVAPQVDVEITDVVPHASCHDEYCLVHLLVGYDLESECWRSRCEIWRGRRRIGAIIGNLPPAIECAAWSVAASSERRSAMRARNEEKKRKL
ncbi:MULTISPECIES: hypothetical protein [unclassified Afipia]|uniref:hypothetical protein n=1 Tax=unclassified Afipia TaxID=2642050 RepID=UPI001267A91C|nr:MULTISPECIES: hypothetical protein [unclassified Afipia]|tara:strand:- start:412 stop:771 length:360 start_codon:yes stop_codon:yes gene_type:complete